MLIAIDIGNTNIVIGGIQGDAIQFEARIATDRIKTSDQYGVEIKNILALFGVKPCDVDDCIISSVVPPVFNSVYTGLVKMTGKHPLVVGPGIKTGLNIQMDVLSQVGSDRIVIAVAALAEYEPPLILMDLGTATTIEVVDRGSTYLGGCIIPGVRTSLDALTSRAGPAARHPPGPAGRVIGKNTVGLHAQRASCTAPPPCWTACWTGWRRSWAAGPRWWPRGGWPSSSCPCAAGRSSWRRTCCSRA